MKLSCKFKLIADEGQQEELRQLMFQFNKACNHISRVAFDKKVFNNFSLHHLLYREVREKFNLPSQFVISALSKVADAYKTELTKSRQEERPLSLCRFKPYSAVAYDSRLLTYGKEMIVSIKTLAAKRLKLATCIRDSSKVPFFKGEADLVYSRNKFYIVQTVDIPKAPLQEIKGYLGVDLGIVKIAVDSDGEAYTSDKIETKRIKYSLQRSRLKKAKTSSSRRHLKKIGNKEARFRKDVNHCISKAIVAKAERTSQGIAMEDLRQFFDKTRVRKEYRAQRCSWSFFQLRGFVGYKSALKGVPLVLENPAYTSQRCSACGCVDKRNRRSRSLFLCVACGHTENADFNASKNIKYWAAVNQPIVTKLSECSESVTSLRACPWGS